MHQPMDAGIIAAFKRDAEDEPPLRPCEQRERRAEALETGDGSEKADGHGGLGGGVPNARSRCNGGVDR